MTQDISNLSPRNILVCQLQQIGDVVISTAMVELLTKRYPGVRMDFLTEAKCAPILENNPHLTKIWTTKGGSFPADLRTNLAIRGQQYDLVLDFQQLPRSRRATLFSGAKIRLSYETKWYKRLAYNHFAPMKKGGYAGKYKAQLLKPLGIEWNMQPPRMYLTDKEISWAGDYLQSQGLTKNDTLITLDPTHWSDTRRWPARHYGSFIQLALEKRPDLRFYLFHGPGEKEQVEEVVRLSGREDRCILPPDTPPSLRETAAVIHHATAQLGNCSAPRHMATALNKPTMTIIGSNGDTAWTFPDRQRHRIGFHYLPCSKCNRNTCEKGTLECLNDLLPETVTDQFLDLLDDNAGQ